jgi:hypothetical protein
MDELRKQPSLHQPSLYHEQPDRHRAEKEQGINKTMIQVMGGERKTYLLLSVIKLLPLSTQQFTNFTCSRLAKAVLELKDTNRNQHLGFQS